MIDENATNSAIKVQETEDATIKKDPLVANFAPQGEKILAIFGYFGPLCVLPLAIKPNSKLCQLHGKQGLVIFLIFLIFSWLAWFSWEIGLVLKLAQIGLSVLGIMTAWKGSKKPMPFLKDIVSKLKW